jgi:hypothetical protein
MTLFIASIVLGILAASVVIFPIVSRRLALVGDPIPGGVLDAEARKRVALNSLKEIEYDRIGGKLDDADYQRLRAQLEREAMVALAAVENAHAAEAQGGEFQITHACGFVNPPGSRFCSGCGRKLA